MANEKIVSKNPYEIYREILLQNSPKIIGYFKSLGTYDSKKLTEINNQVAEKQQRQSNLKQKMTDTEQKYRGFVFDSENSDINPLRGDNGLVTYYTEVYNNILTEERQLTQQLQEIYNDPLWKNSQIVLLLTQLFQKKLKVDEIKEAIAWQSSEAYKSITRYEKDSDDDSGGSYDSLLRQYKEDLDSVCKKCLSRPEIVAYVNMVIADINVQRMQNAKKPYHKR